MINAQQALDRLKQGNQRFVSGNNQGRENRMHRAQLSEGQTPFAIVLGCSDSRVPAEIIFDQGLGDLFVIRVAGNIVAPSQVGSVEFAAQQFGTPLVVVLGHSNCGAVQASLDSLQRPVQASSSNVMSIVNRIRPVIEPLIHTDLKDKPSQLVSAAIRANILASTNHLRHGSQLLETLLSQGELMIVGAEYSLENGRVEFLEAL